MAIGNPLNLFTDDLARQANAQIQAGYGNARNDINAGYNQAGQDLRTNFAGGFNAWAPYLQQGQTLSPELTTLLSGGPGATDFLKSTPGFQFGLDTGLNQTAAKMQQLGYGGSGNEALALNKYGTDYALQQAYVPLVNALISGNQQGIAGAQGTSNLWQNLGTQLSGFDTSRAGTLGNLDVGSSNANAQATQAQYGAASNVANLFGGGARLAANLFGAFSG
jgi:hypothetical protein